MDSLAHLVTRPLLPGEVEVYRSGLIARFAAEKMASEGLNRDLARQEAASAWERARKNSENQQLLGLMTSDSTTVGSLWLDFRQEWGQPCLWIYDLLILPPYQHMGFGRQAMRLVEGVARQRKLSTIGLHVFGENQSARALYQRMGYRPTSIVMRKDLE